MRKTKSLCEEKGQICNKEGDITASRQTWRAQVYGSLALIIAATALGLPLAVRAQDEPKQTLPKNGKGWKVNAVSELFPDKVMAKMQARIEGDWLVCRSGDSVVLDVPLKAISRMSRDTFKDYPAAEFLRGAAMQPSGERARFGSKRYREEMAARAMLGGFAFFALRFPRHKEEVHVFWLDEEGEHGAQFLMGRKEGRAMLQKLETETGMKARDAEKERKDYEERTKELQRWIKQNDTKGPSDQETPQPDHPVC